MAKMDPHNLSEIVGNVAVVTTILQFLSGILVCRKYIQNKTTGDASPLPFIFGVFSGVLWFLYGAYKIDDKIMMVNVIGITLMLIYTSIFIYYSLMKTKVIKQCVGATFALVLIMYYGYNETNYRKLLKNLGMAASVVTLMTVAAPMAKLKYVLKVKSTECLPFPMIFMSFLVCSLWTCYGALQNDIYLWGVNFIGVGLAVCQLSLFVYFPKKSGAASPSLLPKYVVH